MKKLFFTTLLSLFTIVCCFSQDTITLKTSENIKAKVLEVSPTEIKYKRFDNLEGPTHITLVSDVFMIRYENGTEGIFNVEKTAPSATPAITPYVSTEKQYFKGQNDAERYYKGYKGAGTGTLVVSLISPLVGLIPAIACSATSPKELNLNYPDAELMRNDEYQKGYKAKAKKIKQGKVWKNFGIAFGVNLLLVLALGSGQ
jgi:hypothetical protein